MDDDILTNLCNDIISNDAILKSLPHIVLMTRRQKLTKIWNMLNENEIIINPQMTQDQIIDVVIMKLTVHLWKIKKMKEENDNLKKLVEEYKKIVANAHD